MNKLIFIGREKDVPSHSPNQFHTGMFPLNRRIAFEKGNLNKAENGLCCSCRDFSNQQPCTEDRTKCERFSLSHPHPFLSTI